MDKIHKKGKDLTRIELDVINSARKKAFNSKKDIAPTGGDDEWGKDFFLIRNDSKFVAMGCLEEIM